VDNDKAYRYYPIRFVKNDILEIIRPGIEAKNGRYLT